MKTNQSPDKNLTIKAVCPSCHKLAEFRLHTVAELKAFTFRPHDCPNLYCRKRGLNGWIVK